MSPKKITDADKLEIVALYRQTRATAAVLATRFGVSNSTIGRLLKTSIPEAEYDLIIQQKRGVRGSSDARAEASLVEIAEAASTPDNESIPMAAANDDDTELERSVVADLVDDRQAPSPAIEIPVSCAPQAEDASLASETIVPSAPIAWQMAENSSTPSLPTGDRLDLQPLTSDTTEDLSASKRLVRRRSSARIEDVTPTVAPVDPIDRERTARLSASQTSIFTEVTPPIAEIPPSAITTGKRTPQLPVLRDLRIDRSDRFSELVEDPAVTDRLEDEVEEEPENVNALAAMFGEEIADGEDDDEEDDDDEDWDEEAVIGSPDRDRDILLSGNRAYLEVTPLSQAILPRTCYIVIDKFAEPIVRPLKDFAELGQIPGEEIQQRTLPIFDNHRVAKRFSNQRTQRVIKIPDSRIFQKTIVHMRSKGIARLLVDGNIYSLN